MRGTPAVLSVVLLAACGGSSGGGGGGGTNDGAPGSADGSGGSEDGAGATDGRPGGGGDAEPPSPYDAPITRGPGEWRVTDGVLPSSACVPYTLADSAMPEDMRLDAAGLVIQTDVASESLYYFHDDTVLDQTRPFTIAARLRVDSASATVDYRAAAQFGANFGGTANRIGVIQIEDGAMFLLAGDNERGAEVAVPTSDTFHTYTLDIDPTTFAMTVSYDGDPLLTGTAIARDTAIPARVYFGDTTGYAAGRSHWEWFRHDALRPVTCP